MAEVACFPSQNSTVATVRFAVWGPALPRREGGREGSELSLWLVFLVALQGDLITQSSWIIAIS